MKIPLAIIFCVLFLPAAALAQSQPTSAQQASTKGMKLDSGEEIFKASCIGCHGPNGVGQDPSILGFEPPPAFPDFTDCNGSTREKTSDWSAIIHEGGPIRAFSEIMPSWKEALTDAQIDKVIAYLRSRCEESAWPLGELNMPRALFTEKAFPEDEWLLTTAITTNGSGSGAVSGKLVYEKRLGPKNQVELVAPFGVTQQNSGNWFGGVGDFALGFKRVMLSTLNTGSILSVQGEIVAPTGNEPKGLGSGVTTFETFAAFGQLLSPTSFLQAQVGFELPTDTTRAPKAFFWKTAIGKSFSASGVGRLWTPMVELLADRDLQTGAVTNWDIVPEFQLTLSRRQHVRVAFGVKTPLNNTAGRPTEVAFYALWDVFDGSPLEGW